jgi:crotonyl-CoA reductase
MKAWVISKSSVRSHIEKKNLPKASEIMELKDDIVLPEISDDQALIKLSSTGLNFNSVWSSKLYPVDPFTLLNNHIRRNRFDKNQSIDYFIPGSDACGQIIKIGKNNYNFKEGDEVVIHCAVIDEKDMKLNDPMLSKTQSIWGYETNFGSFSEYCIVKSSQLLNKPKNLSSEICGSYMLTLGTAYRMIVSQNGGKLKKGETCLIWGAAGGLGVFAIQIVKYLGGIPVCVVSTKEKMEYCKKFGAEHVICLENLDNKDFLINNDFNMKLWMEFSLKLKSLIGTDKVDMVFEHIGKDTMALSIYLLRRGGRVVTCAATSGFFANIDIRYIWMEMKKIIGSHFCNLQEAKEANELISNNIVKHVPSKIIEFKSIPDYLDKIDKRSSLGKIAVKI